MTDLGSWIASAGGFVSDALQLEDVGAGGGRGLCVSRDVSAGEPLLGVPRRCTLHACAGEGLKAHEALMLRLLEEEACGSNSEFVGYLESLPECIPLLRDWPDAELRRRMPARLVARVQAQRDNVDTTIERVNEAGAARAASSSSTRAPVDASAGASSGAFASSPSDVEGAAARLSRFSRERCLWAESVVRSRSLAFTAADDSPALALVPLFDMANHLRAEEEALLRAERGGASEYAARSAAPSVLITDDGFTVLCARSDLRAGEQVLVVEIYLYL